MYGYNSLGETEINMKKPEADKYAATFNAKSTTYAEVMRILPIDIDPPKQGDNGWDIKVTYLPDFNCYED